MKSNVLLASLIAAISLQTGALGAGRSGAHRQHAGRAPQRPRPGTLDCRPRAEGQAEERQAAARRSGAGTLERRTTSANFFRGNSARAGGHAADPPSATRAPPARTRSGQSASQFMLQRAASSYSTSSNALGFGLYRVTPRETVAFKERHAPGTILVRQREKRLYYVNGDGTAIRYAIAVGREGAAWSGTSSVSDKREWPDWTPTPNILAKQPDLPRHVEGGPANPLGARALYLGQTMYRIHGTNEPWRIGEEASSGCIRLTNDDIVDLYNRTRLGATVIVTR